MAHEKQYTAKQAALAVLERVGEVLKKHEELAKAEPKRPAKEDTTSEKADPSVRETQNAENEHAQGKVDPGIAHPKEHVEAPSDDTRSQTPPGSNPKEQAEGNNELAGTTPTQVGQDGKNLPGYDEMKSHLKLAKFIGRMEHKRTIKRPL